MKYMASFFLRSEFPGVPCWEPSAGDLISELSITLNTQPLATGFPQSLSSVQINNSQNMERVMGPALHWSLISNEKANENKKGGKQLLWNMETKATNF